MLINGEKTDLIPVTDRGLQYGDGLFATIAVFKGKPAYMQRHLQRLQKGCANLQIPFPGEEVLLRESLDLCQGQDKAVLKIIITRGSGGRGYSIPSSPAPTRIVSIHPWPEYPKQWKTDGIHARVCQHIVSRNPALAGIKHLNRLDQILASQEWDNESIAEGLMLDESGNVIEGTKTNVFIVRDQVLYTPDLTCAGVEGIMRNLVMELAELLGIPLNIQPLSLDDVKQADEMFFCNSIVGLWPVRQLDEHAFPKVNSLVNKLVFQLNQNPKFSA